MHDSKVAVPATLDKAAITLMVDTGAQITLLADTVVAMIEKTDIDGTVSGFGGSRVAILAEVQRLDVGRLHGQVAALTSTLGADFAKNGLAGILGMDILGAYDVDLDVIGGDVRLYHALGSCAAPPVYLQPTLYTVAELPADAVDPRPLVPVRIGDQTFVGMLDTGAQGVALSARAARRLGLDAAALGDDPRVGITGIGTRHVEGRLHLLPQMALGDLAIRRVPALMLPENFDPRVDVVLGFDIARRIHFWISNSSRQLIMQYPPLASTPLPAGS